MAKRRRFQAQQTTILRDLRLVMDKMRATGLGLNQDIMAGTAEIVFDRAGRRYFVRREKYDDPLDNLRGAQLTITYLWRAVEEYGVTTDEELLDNALDQILLGLEAPPDDNVLLLGSGQAEWWEILGVEPDAS